MCPILVSFLSMLDKGSPPLLLLWVPKMKKDLIIAVILGFATGALVAAILLNLPYIYSFISKKTTNSPTSLFLTPPPHNTSISDTMILDILEPLDDSITATKSVTLKGKTQKDTILIIENDINQDALASQSDGTFSFPLSLGLGNNEVIVTAYNQNGDSISKTVNIVYQDEKL
jgi:hypothetical protein